MKILVIALIVGHFFFDWILQSREMARRKSSYLEALIIHLSIYYLGMLLITVLFSNLSFTSLVLLNGINIILHGIIDWNIWTLAKKWFGKYKGDKKEYLFYSTIAIDQTLHLVILILLLL